MDVVLFDKIELPVLIPEDIIESQKALSKKPKRMTRAERGAAAAAKAAAAAQMNADPRFPDSPLSATMKTNSNRMSPAGRSFRGGNTTSRLAALQMSGQ